MTLGLDLATGVAASFLYEGIKKCQSGLLFALNRKQRIERALVSKPPADRRGQKALEDLAIVLANAHGQYTESVAKFFRELEKSALPEALLRCILADTDTEPLFPALN